jgi:protein TonB
MRQETISASRLKSGQSRRTPAASRRRRLLPVAASLSVIFHLAAALLVVLLPRVLPPEARPQEPGTVELLMVEKAGAAPSEAANPSKAEPKPAPPEQQTTTAKAETPPAAPAPKVDAAPPVQDHGDEPVPVPGQQSAARPPEAEDKPVQSSSAEAAKEPTSEQATAAPPSQEPLVFDLEGTESQSNAIALGARILPAMPDNRFRNRPPAYPVQAAVLGQHGAVVVVIHVAENGSATGVDIVESSGFDVLDQAAVAAVRKWRFHPAMQNGQAVAFDMPFRFIFQAD